MTADGFWSGIAGGLVVLAGGVAVFGFLYWLITRNER